MTDVERAYRNYDRAKFVLQVAAVLMLALALSLLLLNSAQARAQRSRQLALARLLVECTTPPADRKPPVVVKDPGSDCYTRALREQGKAVSTIGDLSIVAATCGAAHPGDIPATRTCVERGLAQQDAP